MTERDTDMQYTKRPMSLPPRAMTITALHRLKHCYVTVFDETIRCHTCSNWLYYYGSYTTND